MPLPRYSKGASSLQKRYRLSPIFEDIFVNDNPLYTYGGYFDIAVRDSAFSLAGDPPHVEGDPIGELVQLVAGASGSNITFADMSNQAIPRQMAYRTEATYSTGNQFTNKPVMFYPDGYFDGLFVPDGNGGWTTAENATIQLALPVGSFNVPEGTIIEEYTVAMTGARLVHEMGIGISDIQAMLAEASQDGSALGLPVPLEPGTLIISVTLDENRIPQLTILADGVPMDPAQYSALVPTDPVPPGQGLDMDEFLYYLTMPCWGTQKMLVISRALTEQEMVKVSDRMMRTTVVRA